MSRRSGLPWAPTSLPPLRKQWCTVMGEGLERLREQGSTLALQAEEDLAGLAASTLFWVARDMTDLAVGAASSLPEWSPAAAVPTTYGLIGFARPAGVFDWPVPDGSAAAVNMPVDAMSWGIRDGRVGVSCAFRTERIAAQLNPGLARLPLIAQPMGVWDLEAPVAHRVEGGAISPMSVLGACWLLMEQPSVTQTRRIGSAATGSGDAADAVEDADSVRLIELRRLRSADGAAAQGVPGGGRQRDRRWWVSGHWRQQACGPGRAFRKPVWISPFLKGPEDAPLTETPRVYLWRR